MRFGRNRLSDVEREEVKKRGTSRTKGLLLIIVCILVLAALPIFLFERPETFFDVDGEALASSVEDELPGEPNVRECTERKDTERKDDVATPVRDAGALWTCRAEFDKGRPPRPLRIELDDERCWTSRIAGGDAPSGCIGLMDYLLDEPAFFE